MLFTFTKGVIDKIIRYICHRLQLQHFVIDFSESLVNPLFVPHNSDIGFN